MKHPNRFYKKHRADAVWWVYNLDTVGEWIFSFDKKQVFNLFADYPHVLTPEQKELFDKENPFWADFFKDRLETGKVTLQEAYAIVKDKYQSMVAVDCLEFPDFYAFGLTEKGREGEPVGGGYTTVNKKNGALGGFSPVQDFDAFYAAKEISIDELNK